jgi:trehalose 6-phosphate phosphatase
MKILNPEIDPETLYKRIHDASQKALLLDYDGTLSPFQADRDKAFPYPGVPEALNNIMQAADIRLVIISGRWIKDLTPLLKIERQPEIWGSHGLERLKPDGSYEIASMDETALKGLVAADEWIQAAGLSDRCEEKPGSLALHWRGLEKKKVTETRNQVEQKWSLFAEIWGLSLTEFDGGLELRVPGRNKGDAVKEILAELDQNAVVAYLGDDYTDEDGFKSIKGIGIGVLVREELRPTAADLWIKPPEELIAFLSKWLSDAERNHGCKDESFQL